jgi:protein O-GlcNAc transferase
MPAELLFADAERLYRDGDLQAALAKLQAAVRSDASVAAYHYRLANVLEDLGRAADAQASYRRAIEIDPRHAKALNNLGTLLELAGRTEEALACYRRAFEADAELVAALGNLAALLHRSGRPQEAARLVDEALAPGTARSAVDWLSLGNALQGMGRHDDAVQCYDRARTIDPALREASMRRQASLLGLGYTARAIDGYREWLDAHPEDADAARRLLLSLAFEPSAPEAYFEEHAACWGRVPYVRRERPPALDRPGDKLRIGYVSADFSAHPMGVVLAPIIDTHDRSAFEVLLYSDVAWPDTTTGWFRSRANAWRDISGLPDERAAAQIREDRVDILVVVASHFDDNRPLLARWRAAPVQASFWDTASSAIPEMDYLIADRGVVPRHAVERFSERVLCIPTSYVRRPPEAPAPRPRAGGGITFGSFNAPAKLSEPALRAWAELLRQVPASTLLFQYQDVFANPSARERIARVFRSVGVPEQQLRFDGRAIGQPLERYSLADIALDPFPFNGMTTTFVALWMGVPVLALEGDRMVARCAATALRKVGLDDWIAGSEQDYATRGRRLAADPDELSRLRATLRDRVLRSPLCDARARSRQLERLYQAMWRRALAGVAPTRTPGLRRRPAS